MNSEKTQQETDRRKRTLIIAAALLALFLGAMDALIMSAAMPTIVADLGGTVGLPEHAEDGATERAMTTRAENVAALNHRLPPRVGLQLAECALGTFHCHPRIFASSRYRGDT